jgi:transcriptional regulator with XRE-family HTH domain
MHSLQRYAMRHHRLDFSDAFALVLQRHRKAKKMSKQILAQKAGLHQTYIGKIEDGLSNPSLDAANAIAEALGIPFAELITEAERERKAEIVSVDPPNAPLRESRKLRKSAS